MKIFPIFLIIILSACSESKTNSTNDEPIIIGGQCIYEDFNKVGYISKFEIDERDSIIEIQFTIEGESSTDLLRLKGKDVKTIGHNLFNLNSIKDSNLRYSIEGTRIAKGSCYPYLIDKVSIKI